MAHTVIPPPRGTTVTLELTHKGNINDKTIPERDREVRDFNVTLLASLMEVLLTTCKTCDPSPGRLPLRTYLRDPQLLPKESNKTPPSISQPHGFAERSPAPGW